MTYVILLIALLFAIWNGLTIKWYLTKEQRYSKAWHAVGFVVRSLPVVMLYPDWVVILIYLNIAWTLYDMIINIVNGWNLFYIGNTSAIDRIVGKWLFFCKGVLLLITIIYAII